MAGSSDRAALIANGIFSIGLLVLAIIVSIYHLIATFRSTKNLCNRQFFHKHPSLLLSYVLVFVACISGVSLTMDSVIVSALCSSAQYYGPSLYSIFKTIVYLILGCRIYISFKDSMYAYNTKWLTVWLILLTVWTFFNVIAGNLTVVSSVEEEEGTTKCLVTPSILYIISQALLDVISGVVNCVLFVRPICKLYKLAGDNVKIKGIAYKQCILSLIAIISSIFAMVGIGAAPDFVPVFVASDMLISTLCVVLMYKWNAFIAQAVFCCCMPKPQHIRMNENELVVTVPSKTGNSGDSNTQKKQIKHIKHAIGASTTVKSKTQSLAQPSINNSDETRERDAEFEPTVTMTQTHTVTTMQVADSQEQNI